MVDFVKVSVQVTGGSYTLSNKKTNKTKSKTFDYFNRPLDLQGRITKIRELEENTEKELINNAKEIWFRDFKRYLAQFEKKYSIVDCKLNYSIVIEKASEQTAHWCIDNLKISDIVKMGLTIIKED